MRRLKSYFTGKPTRPQTTQMEATVFLIDTPAFLVATDPQRPQSPPTGEGAVAGPKTIIWWGGRPAVRH